MEGSAEGEVVRGVLRVAGVQEEGDLAPGLAVNRGQPPLQPGHRGRVGDVKQRSHRHVLEGTIINIKLSFISNFSALGFIENEAADDRIKTVHLMETFALF